ncbi:MAG TPA: type II toxin-antitoxin system Phd/YefM family antitoxin [Myxococcota bacterium]|nr:type II toxin-antitoxin system Phd/YefM family antitoxin [Myxococcota bacterium]
MAIDVREIHSLTEFKRDTNRFLRRLRSSGSPLVLTVNGRAELVVFGSKTYQEIAETLDALAGIRRGLESMKKGKGRPARTVVSELAKKHGIATEGE